jgi:tyrosine-protein kinase Etk/Wzc
MTPPYNPPSYPDPYDPRLGNDNIDLKRYISLFISNWYWFAISMFLAITLAYGINRWSEKVYTVSSTLLIKADQSAGLSNIFPNSDGYKSQQNLNNEIGILKSFNLNYKVMRELPSFYIDYIAVGKRGIAETRLYKNCPFEVVYDSLEKQTFNLSVGIKLLSDQQYELEIDGGKNYSRQLAFGERFNEMGFDFKIIIRDRESFRFSPNASNRYYFKFISPITLAGIYRSKLSVIPLVEDASLVTLTTSGTVALQEIDYLNKLMDVYLDFGLEFKNKTAGQTIEFIESQLGIISDSLHLAEGDLESFKLVNRFLDISREGVVIQSKLEKIDGERTSLLLQKNYYNYLKDYVESKKEIGDIIAPSAMGVTDQTLIGLVGELTRLQQHQRQLELNLDESIGPMKLAETNIVSVRAAIIENINDGLMNIENSISDADTKLSDIEQDIRKLPSTERQMINIQRKFDLNNTVYTFLLEKRAEAGIAKASNVPDNRIIDNAGAYTTSRIKPKEKNNLMIAIILGLLVPLFGIILIDYQNNKIIDKKDIEKGTGAPIIGYISHNSLSSEMPVVEKPGSTLAESFRSARTNLKYFIKDTKSPVISVSSTITAEGKTFISANLSAILAISGKKVLLVGLDLRKPRIHRLFGINNKTGISNFLIGQEKFEDVIVKTEVENLWYATSGPVPPNPAELIDSPAMIEFIEKAKKEFDFIVIDTPPVAIVTDALLCSAFTDFYLFVVRQRYSSKNTLKLIDDLYKNENLRSLGILINDISLSGYYGYGLRYGYSPGYGYSYGYNYYGSYADHMYGYSGSSKSYYSEEG